MTELSGIAVECITSGLIAAIPPEEAKALAERLGLSVIEESAEIGNAMFTTARTELRELLRLVAERERYDATLAASPDIKPTEEATKERMRKEQRILALMAKYELGR